MTNKFAVIINSLKVPNIKKLLLYEMKFLVPNYSCLQNPWLGGNRPQIPVLSVLNWICWTPPWRTKFLGTPLEQSVKQNSRTARTCTVSVHCNSYLQCLTLNDNKIHLLRYVVLLYLIFRAQYWKTIILTSVAVPKCLCVFIYVTLYIT